MRYVDPIQVREEKARLKVLEDAMRSGAHAAEALLWFADHANAGPKKRSDFKPPVTVTAQLSTASAVDGYAAAQSFITAVARDFAAEILAKAIERAGAQFERAEIARQDLSRAHNERVRGQR